MAKSTTPKEQTAITVAKITARQVIIVTAISAVSIIAGALIQAKFTAPNNTENRVDDRAKNDTATSPLDASSVAIGSASTNVNDFDRDQKWQFWFQELTSVTSYVGVQRRVKFDPPFDNTPKVEASMKLINVAGGEDLMKRVGFDTDVPKLQEWIRAPHSVVRIGSIEPDGFVLMVGIGLPTEPAKSLKDYVNSQPLNMELVEHLRASGDIRVGSSQLDEDDKWMINWHEIVGTIDVVWFAQVKAN